MPYTQYLQHPFFVSSTNRLFSYSGLKAIESTKVFRRDLLSYVSKLQTIEMVFSCVGEVIEYYRYIVGKMSVFSRNSKFRNQKK